jgi:hypothetical protein
MLFVESAWSVLRFDSDRDRGDILEESWRRQWPRALDRDFLDLRVPDAPILMLNGATAETGCRFNGSVLDANGRGRDDTVVTGCLETADLQGASGAVLPATVDLVDFLCDDDRSISLAAAALFTARFPGISPVGAVKQCSVHSDEDALSVDDPRDPDPETFVVDGGYLEGSGTATVLDLWHALAPLIAEHNRSPQATACVVPFFAQIDNSYLDPLAPGDVEAPPELLGLQEASANKRNRNGYTTASRQAAQVAFRQPFRLGGVTIVPRDTAATTHDILEHEITDRFALFSLRSHPGAEAPLGWTLSKGSFTDLFGQYELNSPALSAVDRWYEDMDCIRPR